jgi:hypothetical protein
VLAFYIVTWAAIVVLFFGLAAVLREVRLLRGIVARNPDGFTAAQPDLSLGEQFANGHTPLGSGRRLVVAADSGCPLCLAVVDRLAARAAEATLLTHEPAAVWDGIAHGLTVVSDRESWRAISHLSPPVLMLVDSSGSVRKMVLPVRVEEVDHVLGEWSDLVNEGAKEGVSGDADVRADS